MVGAAIKVFPRWWLSPTLPPSLLSSSPPHRQSRHAPSPSGSPLPRGSVAGRWGGAGRDGVGRMAADEGLYVILLSLSQSWERSDKGNIQPWDSCDKLLYSLWNLLLSSLYTSNCLSFLLSISLSALRHTQPPPLPKTNVMGVRRNSQQRHGNDSSSASVTLACV